jgi:hypothetical protein
LSKLMFFLSIYFLLKSLYKYWLFKQHN